MGKIGVRKGKEEMMQLEYNLKIKKEMEKIKKKW